MPPIFLDDDEERQATTSTEQFYGPVTDFLPPVRFGRSSEISSEDDGNLLDGSLFLGDAPPYNSSVIGLVPSTVGSPASSDPETDEDTQNSRGHDSKCLGVIPTPDHVGEIAEFSAGAQKTGKIPSISPSTLIHPRSQYGGYVPPLPVCSEANAVWELRQEIDTNHSASFRATESKYATASISSDDDNFVEFELTDFAIYLPENPLHPYELRGLQNLSTKNGHSSFLLDGILCAGNIRRYVQGIPFEVCSIGNYGEDFHTVGDNIWIRSEFNNKSNLFYRLKAPSWEYKRFHTGFLWLADLAKHFVDYCQASEDKLKVVSIHNFRKDFSQWVQRTHKGSPNFQSWYRKYQSDDFRLAVSANINFLFKESVGVNDRLRKQPIWSQIMEKDFVPLQQIKEEKTIVTQYVYECFEHLRFGDHLKTVAPIRTAQERHETQGKSLHLTVDIRPSRPVVEIPVGETLTMGKKSSNSTKPVVAQARSDIDHVVERQRRIKAIQVGDVISVTKDGEESVWKDEVSRWKAADDCWYIYVQGVYESDKGTRSFHGIWLYKPSDTSCALMRYPFPKELFLSDNCTCSQRRIKEDEVLDVVNVAWYCQPSESCRDPFIRQTYLENDRFVTLQEEHKKCGHFRNQEGLRSSKFTHKYPVGQTVLALPPPHRKSKYGLEPYEIVSYFESGQKEFVILKCLLRRNEIAGQVSCRPNELVYSDKTDTVEAKKVERTCVVRFYSETDVASLSIPPPYSRDGTGNAFYITTRMKENNDNQELTRIEDSIPKSLIQGFDPLKAPTRRKLRGLDLYCGGGNFGRGLEEGGALRNEWAVDYAKTAIHTYFANLEDPGAAKLFFGSVDDQLHQALQGNPAKSPLIPQPGEVDFISAGSPCQGFSVLNRNKNNDKGLKNQSLVASVAAYVDFFRPKYGLLENVLNMAQKGSRRDEDVLSQLICAIVGMGYQLRLFMIDAWSCGSPQSRSRIFVSFAAPGCEPLQHPQLSHSHPRQIRDRGLGQLANGKPFGERLRGPTPFNFVTVGDATIDLPEIGDGRTYQCIPHPDHVMSIGISKLLQLQIEAIPIRPRAMNFVQAWNKGQGVMTKEERDLFPLHARSGLIRENVQTTSRAWGRINPNWLFDNVVVAVCIADSRMGTVLHWDQQRCFTVLEAKRAQSFPDREVILGTPREQMKILGNSVARSVSLALGLALREAWLMSPPDNERPKAMATISSTLLSVRSLGNDALHGTKSFEKRIAKRQYREYFDKTRRSFSKTNSTSIPLQAVTVRDSFDSSDTEDPSKLDFPTSWASLPLRSSPSRNELALSNNFAQSYSNSQSKPITLKRPHKTSPESKIFLSETNRKATKLSSLASPSSFIATEASSTMSSGNGLNQLKTARNKSVESSHLTGNLRKFFTQHVPDKPYHSINDKSFDEQEYLSASRQVKS